LGTVYRGKKKLDDETVLKLYKRRNIPVSYLGEYYSQCCGSGSARIRNFLQDPDP
jgi:hypothetical protein